MTEVAQESTFEALGRLWKQMNSVEKPDFIYASPAMIKGWRRYWRSKRKGKSRRVEITATRRVELGIPAGSWEPMNEWWGGDLGYVDKRCLKRYIRRSARA